MFLRFVIKKKCWKPWIIVNDLDFLIADGEMTMKLLFGQFNYILKFYFKLAVSDTTLETEWIKKLSSTNGTF